MTRLGAPNRPSSAPFPLNPLYPEKSLGFIIPAFTCVEKDTPRAKMAHRLWLRRNNQAWRL